MKKAISIAVVVLMLALSMVSAFALVSPEEQKIVDALKAGVTVNGQTVTLPADYINQAENYLINNDVDITAENAAAIIAKIDNAKAVIVEKGITNLDKNIPSDVKDQLVAIAEEAAKVENLKVTVSGDKSQITIVDNNGNQVFRWEENKTLPPTGAENVDMSAAFAIIAAFATVGVAAAFVAKKVKA